MQSTGDRETEGAAAADAVGGLKNTSAAKGSVGAGARAGLRKPHVSTSKSHACVQSQLQNEAHPDLRRAMLRNGPSGHAGRPAFVKPPPPILAKLKRHKFFLRPHGRFLPPCTPIQWLECVNGEAVLLLSTRTAVRPPKPLFGTRPQIPAHGTFFRYCPRRTILNDQICLSINFCLKGKESHAQAVTRKRCRPCAFFASHTNCGNSQHLTAPPFSPQNQ